METKITDRIKTFEDALKETGRPDVPDFKDVPEDLRPHFQAQYKAVVIAEALNEGWTPNYRSEMQCKWSPWFCVIPSGFAFNGADYEYSLPTMGSAARLCFKSEELATYAGRQFTDIYERLILK
jgi:hypothetical protein